MKTLRSKMKISNYTVPELNQFRDLCNFTQEELDYFNFKAKDESNVHIALAMCISEPKVSKLARSVKEKIRKVEKYLDGG